MTASSSTSLSTLVSRARKKGKPDAFSGKRSWTRYTLGMRLEVSADPTRPSATRSVMMHNISGGGLGFWSREPIAIGSAIHIRDISEGSSHVWLPAHVVHCSVGLRGHLVGAAFDDPASPDDDVEPEALSESEEQTPRSASVRSPRRLRSIQSERALLGAGVCSLAGIIIVLVPQLSRSHLDPLTALFVSIGGAVGMGALIGWLSARKEACFVRRMRQSVREMGKGTPDLSSMAEAPSKEFGTLQRAFLDLGAKWRRREDNERLQRQKLEELAQIKSNILAIVSHDLRTPLTSILLYAQMLNEELETLSAEDRSNFLKIISDECTRLSRLVDDLLEVQRLESDRADWKLESQDLSASIRSAVRVFEALASSKSMTLVVNCPESLPPVAADVDRIMQVLNNLLSNALKYTQAGGTVVVTAEARGQEVLLRVADNGPGIPRDKWDQVFDRFAQLGDVNVSEIAGVGLGLYIVKKIVEAHGGTVWINSEVGRGSEFFVALPTESALTQVNTPQAGATPPERILLCDPDPELAATIAQTLRRENFDVRTAHSGCRLLAQLDHGDVDIVITDVLLPDMNAADLLDALNRVRQRSFRLIVHSYAGDARDLSRRGVDVFLRRPVSGEELLQAVGVALQKGATTGLTVLLIESQHVDVAQFKMVLSEVGHMVIAARTIQEATSLVRDYTTDIVLVSERSLSGEWEEIDMLQQESGGALNIIVLCEAVRRKERKLAAIRHANALPYRSGQEQEVVEELIPSESMILPELSS